MSRGRIVLASVMTAAVIVAAGASGELDRRLAVTFAAGGCSGPEALPRRRNRPPSALGRQGETRC